MLGRCSPRSKDNCCTLCNTALTLAGVSRVVGDEQMRRNAVQMNAERPGSHLYSLVNGKIARIESFHTKSCAFLLICLHGAIALVVLRQLVQRQFCQGVCCCCLHLRMQMRWTFSLASSRPPLNPFTSVLWTRFQMALNSA